MFLPRHKEISGLQKYLDDDMVEIIADKSEIASKSAEVLRTD